MTSSVPLFRPVEQVNMTGVAIVGAAETTELGRIPDTSANYNCMPTPPSTRLPTPD